MFQRIFVEFPISETQRVSKINKSILQLSTPWPHYFNHYSLAYTSNMYEAIPCSIEDLMKNIKAYSVLYNFISSPFMTYE